MNHRCHTTRDFCNSFFRVCSYKQVRKIGLKPLLPPDRSETTSEVDLKEN